MVYNKMKKFNIIDETYFQDTKRRLEQGKINLAKKHVYTKETDEEDENNLKLALSLIAQAPTLEGLISECNNFLIKKAITIGNEEYLELILLNKYLVFDTVDIHYFFEVCAVRGFLACTRLLLQDRRIGSDLNAQSYGLYVAAITKNDVIANAIIDHGKLQKLENINKFYVILYCYCLHANEKMAHKLIDTYNLDLSFNGFFAILLAVYNKHYDFSFSLFFRDDAMLKLKEIIDKIDEKTKTNKDKDQNQNQDQDQDPKTTQRAEA